MKKLLLLAGVAILAAVPANATTITGTYDASIVGGHASLTDNLASPFSLTSGAIRSLFITVDPNATCTGTCNPTTGTITVHLYNLTANGHNFGNITETGIYTANYSNQTDSVVWNGATNQGNIFGLDQDGSIPLIKTFALNGGSFGTLDFNFIDGADWNVQTYAEATLLAPVPTPIAGTGPLFVSGLAGLLALARRRKKKLNQDLPKSTAAA